MWWKSGGSGFTSNPSLGRTRSRESRLWNAAIVADATATPAKIHVPIGVPLAPVAMVSPTFRSSLRIGRRTVNLDMVPRRVLSPAPLDAAR